MISLLSGVKSSSHVCSGVPTIVHTLTHSNINRYQSHIFIFFLLFTQNNISEFIHVKNYGRSANKNQYGKFMEIVVDADADEVLHRMKRVFRRMCMCVFVWSIETT